VFGDPLNRWVQVDFKWRDQCSAGNEERRSRNTVFAVTCGDSSGIRQQFDYGYHCANWLNQIFRKMVNSQFFCVAIGPQAVHSANSTKAGFLYEIFRFSAISGKYQSVAVQVVHIFTQVNRELRTTFPGRESHGLLQRGAEGICLSELRPPDIRVSFF
jgi:hypothetical protein